MSCIPYLLIISIIIIIAIMVIISNNIDIHDENVVRILYDGKDLTDSPQRKFLIRRIFNKKVDCHSNIIECNSNEDCTKNCLDMKSHNKICFKGLCRYFPQNTKKSICQNGGQVASYFMYSRIYTACICPPNFIGLLCQIPNQMNSSESRTFDLIY